MPANGHGASLGGGQELGRGGGRTAVNVPSAADCALSKGDYYGIRITFQSIQRNKQTPKGTRVPMPDGLGSNPAPLWTAARLGAGRSASAWLALPVRPPATCRRAGPAEELAVTSR